MSNFTSIFIPLPVPNRCFEYTYHLCHHANVPSYVSTPNKKIFLLVWKTCHKLFYPQIICKSKKFRRRLQWGSYLCVSIIWYKPYLLECSQIVSFGWQAGFKESEIGIFGFESLLKKISNLSLKHLPNLSQFFGKGKYLRLLKPLNLGAVQMSSEKVLLGQHGRISKLDAPRRPAAVLPTVNYSPNSVSRKNSRDDISRLGPGSVTETRSTNLKLPRTLAAC